MKISWKHLWQMHQIKIRFFFIGVWNTIFGYLAYVGLDYLFTFVFQKRYLAYMTAAVVANIIATISAFIFFKFYSMYTVTNILGLALLPFFVEVMKIDPKISGALLIPLTAIISYFGHSRFSFVKR